MSAKHSVSALLAGHIFATGAIGRITPIGKISRLYLLGCGLVVAVYNKACLMLIKI